MAKTGKASSIKSLDLNFEHIWEGGIDHFSDASKAHPGFKAVQAKIAAKGGYSQARAGAILAASTRGASKAAKKANPNLRKVKGK